MTPFWQWAARTCLIMIVGTMCLLAIIETIGEAW